MSYLPKAEDFEEFGEEEGETVEKSQKIDEAPKE